MTMISTQIRFFYFAGSMVGGVIFLGTTTAAVLTALTLVSIPGQSLVGIDAVTRGAWGGVFLTCLSMLAGVVISELSIQWFYHRFVADEQLDTFRRTLSEMTGLKIQNLDPTGSKTPAGELRLFSAFAHNNGHPNDLYDLAGRGRLAGAAAINCGWMFILSLLLYAIAVTRNDLEFGSQLFVLAFSPPVAIISAFAFFVTLLPRKENLG